MVKSRRNLGPTKKELLEEFKRPFYEDEVNKKILDKRKLLRLSPDFNKDIGCLRRKWRKFIKIYHDCIKKSGTRFNGRRFYSTEIIERGRHYYRHHYGREIWNAFTPQRRLAHFSSFPNKKEEKMKNRQVKIKNKVGIRKDLFKVAEKYKLYPLDYWGACLNTFLFDGVFFDTRLYIASEKQRHREDNTAYLPSGVNVILEILEDSSTNERRLAIIPFDDSSFGDIEKCRGIINNALKELKKEKGLKKRYYPLPNLEDYKKITQLDKKKKDLKDDLKAEEIWGEIGEENFGEKERKRKNRMKQIRYQYKKRLG